MIANANRILWLPEGDSRNWDYESGGWASSNRNPSGVRIDAESALRATVVLACVRVLSASVAGLPLHLYRRLAGGGKELARDVPLYRVLHTTPNSWQTSYEWRETLMLHLLLHGSAFCEIRGAGATQQLLPLHPSRMKVDRLENGRLRYTYREDKGSSTVYSQDAIMHLRWLSDDSVNGIVPVEIASDAIGLARACEIHGASFFGNGASPESSCRLTRCFRPRRQRTRGTSGSGLIAALTGLNERQFFRAGSRSTSSAATTKRASSLRVAAFRSRRSAASTAFRLISLATYRGVRSATSNSRASTTCRTG
jgi:phage portal protein BeeE